MAERLSDEVIQDGMPDGWEREGDEIVRVYEFDNYLAGVEFVGEVGKVAEEEFHHPEIIVRYEEVEVRFTTHDAGGITQKDISLAEQCNAAF
jgi:4a-hydroxytetrahydrobiopterin dehydratase